jgi:DNA modification methylase
VSATKTPPALLARRRGGIVLHPFAGRVSTGAAAALKGARFVGIGRAASYAAIARARIKHWANATKERSNRGRKTSV